MPDSLTNQLQRLARLHNLLAESRAMGEEGVATARIIPRLDIERKALYRLAQDLRALGAPIVFDQSGKLWSYTRPWNPPDPWLWTLDGADALRWSLGRMLDPDLGKALDQVITSVARPSTRSRKCLPRETGKVDPQIVQALMTAIDQCHWIRISYDKPDGTKPGGIDRSVRHVQPLDLWTWGGMLYLGALAYSKDDPRAPLVRKHFAVSRLREVEPLAKKFRRPSRQSTPSALGAYTGARFFAVIRADAHEANFVRERLWHPEQKVLDLSDGGCEFQLPFYNAEEAARWLLGLGTGFRAVSPPAFVHSTANLARQVAAQYDSKPPKARKSRR